VAEGIAPFERMVLRVLSRGHADVAGRYMLSIVILYITLRTRFWHAYQSLFAVCKIDCEHGFDIRMAHVPKFVRSLLRGMLTGIISSS
jgi:hypothetical protein